MKLVGLTGGIGSGKSTVSSLLADLGAEIIDADAIARELQEPGRPVFARLVTCFGARIVGSDGRLDRAAIAAIVFRDPLQLKQLNRLVHPAIGIEIAKRIDVASRSDRIVVLDIPLLAENPRKGLAGVVVVDTPVDVAVERLVAHRGFSSDDARNRIGRQATREQRRAMADRVIDNSGDLAALQPQIADVWTWLNTLADTTADDLVAYRAPNARS